jgi:hypothetical protein
MTNAHRRAARRELQAARLLGSDRVHRLRGERAPDVVPIRMVDGSVVVPEVKTRAKLPKWLLAAIAQARGYVGGAVPLVVISQTGGEPLAIIPLVELATIVGIRAPKDGEQLLLLGGRK